MMRCADYTVRVLAGGRVLAVIDLDLGSVSVTNDAANVVATLDAQYGLSGKRILYRDSMGVWDELKHAGGRFAGYAPIRERSLEVALAKLGYGRN